MSAGPARSLPLRLYRGATALLEVGATPFLHWRMRRGKEDPARLRERVGYSDVPRPKGPLAWIHGASVGESLSVLPLAAALIQRGFGVVLTTGTVTSSRILSARLPQDAIHQFAPLDGPRAARRFLRHWHPNVAIFVESELWPNLLDSAKRQGVPTVLVNGRMSPRSFARWRRLPGLIGPVLGTFDLVLAQSAVDASRFSALGARGVRGIGNLKFDAAPPPAAPTELADLRDRTAGRPLWVAASTHAGEDELCCAVHRRLKPDLPGLLTIVAPRKTDRGAALADHAVSLGLTVRSRSRRQEICPDTDLYIADTMGELGLFYGLGSAVFIGKSLVDQGGGQNPIEPAKLGNAILHGPHISNFSEIYAMLDHAGGGLAVADETSLADRLRTLLREPDTLAGIAERARRTVEGGAGATARALEALDPILASALRPRPS